MKKNVNYYHSHLTSNTFILKFIGIQWIMGHFHNEKCKLLSFSFDIKYFHPKVYRYPVDYGTLP